VRGINRAFSLIELVIALAILAAVTTIALRATSNLQDQARYQSTVRSLNNIQAAIVGPVNPSGPNGSALVSGFVADTGRLPEYYVSANDPLTQLTPPQPGDPLTELTSNLDGIPAYSLQNSPVDSSVSIGVGWQGPYLSLGAGPTYVRDGWGNSLLCYSANSSTPITTAPGTVGPAIAQIGSTANGQPVYTPNSTLPSSGFVYQASVTGYVSSYVGQDTTGPNAGYTSGPAPNATFSGTPVNPSTPPQTAVASVPVSIWVAYFGPDLTLLPSSPVGEDAWLLAISSGTTWTNTTWTNYSDNNGTETAGTSGSAYSGYFAIPATDTSVSPYTAVTIGPRVLKVYVLPATVVNPTGSDATAFNYYVAKATNTTTAASYPIYATSTLSVTLVPGTQTINLVLPHYSP
jgi:prepilin-type N-terminal cleavage/methylation domain-containing protein